MIPLLGGLLASLAGSGLNILKGAIESKGKDAVEKLVGVKISDSPSAEELFKLKQLEAEHEEELLKLQVELRKTELAFEKVNADVEKDENDNVSKRWKADMSSDSWLSKNIRPIGLLSSLSFVLITLIADCAGYSAKDSVVSMIETLAVSFVMVYCGSRGVEKAMSIRSKKK